MACVCVCVCGWMSLETSRYCVIMLYQYWDLSWSLSQNSLNRSLTRWAKAVRINLGLELMPNISWFVWAGLDHYNPSQVRILMESYQKLSLVHHRSLKLLGHKHSMDSRSLKDHTVNKTPVEAGSQRNFHWWLKTIPLPVLLPKNASQQKIEHQGCNKKVIECVCVYGGCGRGWRRRDRREGRGGGTLMMPLLFFSCPLRARLVRRLHGAQASSWRSCWCHCTRLCWPFSLPS